MSDRGIMINTLARLGMRLTEARRELPEVEKQARKTPRRDMRDERAKVAAAKERVEPMRAEIVKLESDYTALHTKLIRLGAYPGSVPMFDEKRCPVLVCRLPGSHTGTHQISKAEARDDDGEPVAADDRSEESARSADGGLSASPSSPRSMDIRPSEAKPACRNCGSETDYAGAGYCMPCWKALYPKEPCSNEAKSPSDVKEGRLRRCARPDGKHGPWRLWGTGPDGLTLAGKECEMCGHREPLTPKAEARTTMVSIDEVCAALGWSRVPVVDALQEIRLNAEALRAQARRTDKVIAGECSKDEYERWVDRAKTAETQLAQQKRDRITLDQRVASQRQAGAALHRRLSVLEKAIRQVLAVPHPETDLTKLREALATSFHEPAQPSGNDLDYAIPNADECIAALEAEKESWSSDEKRDPLDYAIEVIRALVARNRPDSATPIGKVGSNR